VNTKHDLSAGSTGASIKSQSPASGGTTEICVFCHTPHSASPDAPLWKPFESAWFRIRPTRADVLSALNYPVIEDPLNPAAAGYQVHVKTAFACPAMTGPLRSGAW